LAVSATLCRILGIRQLVLDRPAVLFESFLAGRLLMAADLYGSRGAHPM
jgi:hypothetical protein